MLEHNRLRATLRSIWTNISVEPVVIMYCMTKAISGLPGEEFYLKKGCMVNLNQSAEICDDIHSHPEVQLETQQLVSGIQATKGTLQSIPGVVFVLFAGALMDTYGRKPLLLLSLFGFFILNFVFLVNSIWFHELKVEYLLFECLQDVTGGDIVFFMATKCIIVDITSEETRTWRLAVTDSCYSVGWLIGFQIGNYIKLNFGFTPLFATVIVLVVLNMIYTMVFIKDNLHKIQTEKTGDAQETVKCDRNVIRNVFMMAISSFKSTFRQREGRGRLYICLFMIIFSGPEIVSTAYDVCGFLFYRLQYNITTTDYGHLISLWFIVNSIGQGIVVPFLCEKLHFSDTMIIIIGFTPGIIGFVLEAFLDEVWCLYVIWTFAYIFYFCIFTMSRSAVSKLVSPSEIGRVFAFMGLLQAVLKLLSKPFFGFLYQATLDIFPGLWILVGCAILLGPNIIAIVVHCMMRTDQRRADKHVANEKTEEAVL